MGGGTEAVNASDLKTIRDRISEKVWMDGYRYYQMDLSEEPVQSGENYYLSSLDYSDQKASYWEPIRHIEYTMAYIRYIGKEELEGNQGKRSIALGLINYWIENDYQNENNWYYNQIAAPYDLADISIMMWEWMDDKTIESVTKILNRGTINRGAELTSNSNGSDFLNISIENAIVSSDSKLLNDCMGAINSLIEITSNKTTGIQDDLTYFDYTVLCSGGAYSATYTNNISWFIYLMNGTEYEIDVEKEALFIDFVLDGQWFFHMRNGVPQWSMARSTYQASGGDYIKEALQNLVDIDFDYRKDELKLYLTSFEDNQCVYKINYFNTPGVLVCKGPLGYLAARGCKSDISLTDVQLKEGVLNYNYSYGSNTCFMRAGNEYSTVGAVYDYSMIPGTTSIYENDSELKARWENEYNRTWGHVEFVTPPISNCRGMVDDNIQAGVLCSELHHDGINGQNAFILYNSQMICLGTGFDSDEKDKRILTCVNQCLSDGTPLFLSELQYGECCMNDGFIYKNLCTCSLNIEKKVQRGTVSRVSLNNSDIDRIQEYEVFCCYYGWGSKMDDISYAYSVEPEGNKSVEIAGIVNNTQCQLVEFSDGTVVGYAYADYRYRNMDLKKGFVFYDNQ